VKLDIQVDLAQQESQDLKDQTARMVIQDQTDNPDLKVERETREIWDPQGPMAPEEIKDQTVKEDQKDHKDQLDLQVQWEHHTAAHQPMVPDMVKFPLTDHLHIQAPQHIHLNLFHTAVVDTNDHEKSMMH